MPQLGQASSQPDYDPLSTAVALHWKLAVRIQGDVHGAAMYRAIGTAANGAPA